MLYPWAFISHTRYHLDGCFCSLTVLGLYSYTLTWLFGYYWSLVLSGCTLYPPPTLLGSHSLLACPPVCTSTFGGVSLRLMPTPCTSLASGSRLSSSLATLLLSTTRQRGVAVTTGTTFVLSRGLPPDQDDPYFTSCYGRHYCSHRLRMSLGVVLGVAYTSVHLLSLGISWHTCGTRGHLYLGSCGFPTVLEWRLTLRALRTVPTTYTHPLLFFCGVRYAPRYTPRCSALLGLGIHPLLDALAGPRGTFSCPLLRYV